MVCFSCAVLLFPCAAATGPAATAAVSDRFGFTFTAIGDWGGESDEEPTTWSQRQTAAGLERVNQEMDASFSLMLGDNIYNQGIHAGEDVAGRFRDTFEDVYPNEQSDIPFYACAGNHDYGDGQLANVSSQIAYSQLSSQWRFPALWYKIHRSFSADDQQRSVDLLIIDTVVLCGNGWQNAEFIDEQLQFMGGTADRDRPGDLRKAVAEQQWAWLGQELSNSSADFLLVAGHYPIWSVGNKGSTQCLIDRLLPMLIAHDAHYLSGHDHMLEHFQYDGFNTFVVGAGKECCYAPVNLLGVQSGILRYMLAGEAGRLSSPPAGFAVEGGFASVGLRADSARVAFHAHDGSVLHSACLSRRGKAACQLLPTVAMPRPLLVIVFGAVYWFGCFVTSHSWLRGWGNRPGCAAEPLLG